MIIRSGGGDLKGEGPAMRARCSSLPPHNQARERVKRTRAGDFAARPKDIGRPAGLCYGPSMEMQQARYFVTLAELLNFTRDAEQCNVSQSALTRAIQQLEHEL